MLRFSFSPTSHSQPPVQNIAELTVLYTAANPAMQAEDFALQITLFDRHEFPGKVLK